MLARLLLAALLAATLAPAQRGGGGGGRGGGGGGGNMPMMRPQRQSRLQQFADKLKLNDEQREQTDGIFREAIAKIAPLKVQIDQSRVNLTGLLIQGKTGDELNKAMEAHSALEAQMDQLEVETFSRIWALLKPNQQSKGGQAFELLAGSFDRMGGGGPPRGGPGGAGARGSGGGR
jgi:Spy/CpxP family protein refolding chaperone